MGFLDNILNKFQNKNTTPTHKPGESVLVTGANGFIAGHIIDGLLAKGYQVIGTVRSTTKSEPFEELFKKKYPNGKLTYEIVTDITKAGAFDNVLKKHPEIKVVLHCAASTAVGGTAIEDMKKIFLEPALEGTKGILTSVQQFAPQVTDVVMTSSVASLCHDFYSLPAAREFSAKDWSTGDWDRDVGTNQLTAYSLSKAYSERYAWQFVKENKVNYKLSTILPSVVVGPQLLESKVTKQLNLSNQWMLNMVYSVKLDSTEYANEPFFTIVDVKDIVNYHILAFENPKLRGERIFVSQKSSLTPQELIDLLNEKYPQLRGKIGKGDPNGKCSGLALIKFNMDEHLKAANYKLVPQEETLIGMFDQYLKHHTLDVTEQTAVSLPW
ncbi:unnamed protein product [Ambrosiozyma monospora]|uniref:Unnamed protein product n=1 Tax=Ambrosiozyma monospora TaxID=43982 RepID=A0A9W7DEL5_AMBMO|nr:unnamed protein product [Ambrosiozyma monospora]